MIEPLRAAALAGWARETEPWLVVTEHRADTRIPDLVLARLDEEAVEQRLAAGCIRPLNRAELALMTALRSDCGTSVETLARHTFVRPSSVKRTLRRLEGDGFVGPSSSGCWHRLFLFRPVVTRFISFEAKRSDWRRALVQARAHRLFANEAYVAFDPTFATRFERGLPYYKTAGIGLLALGPESRNVRRVLRSRSGRPFDTVSAALAGEEVLSRLLGLAAKQLPQTRLPGALARIADQAAPQLVGARSKTLEPLLALLAQPALM